MIADTFGFTETHTRGEHRACWHFPVPARGNFYEIDAAVSESPLVKRLASAIGNRLRVAVSGSAIEIIAPTKAEFGGAMPLLRAAVGDTTPEAFTAEIEAVLAAKDRAHTARRRAEEIISRVGTVREKLVEHARTHAGEALAAKIAALRSQYEALAAEYEAEAAQFVERVLDDKEAFSELPDAEIVRAETRASVERHPLRFGGPRISGGSVLGGPRFIEDPGYAEALASLTKRLA